MIVKLPYGADNVALDLRGLRVRPLAPSAASNCPDAGDIVGTALDEPLDGQTITEKAHRAGTATVIVPDATRKAGLPQILPGILGRLRRGGLGDHSMTVLVANGTHPPVGAERLAGVIGAIPAGVTVIEHDSRDRDHLVEIGELRPGLPLRLHRAAVETDLLITVGTVRHHYFAGFGGGPKMVFPGVAGYEEIQANHALVLATENGQWRRDPRCEPGVLDRNPIAEEIARAADMLQPDCAICLVPGRTSGVAWAVSGTWRSAFAAAVEQVRSWFEADVDRPFKLMVACGAGAPSDSTLIQAHKSLDAACRFLEPGGEILYIASLENGLGSPEMTPFVEDPRPERILERLSKSWIQYGHTTLRLVEKTSRFRIRLFSTMEPESARSLGFEPVDDPERTLDRWREKFPGTTVGVMAEAAVFPRS